MSRFPRGSVVHGVFYLLMSLDRYLCCLCFEEPEQRLRQKYSVCKRCPLCKGPWYCSATCQVSDWSEHKRFCSGYPSFAGVKETIKIAREEYYIELPPNIQVLLIRFTR